MKNIAAKTKNKKSFQSFYEHNNCKVKSSVRKRELIWFVLLCFVLFLVFFCVRKIVICRLAKIQGDHHFVCKTSTQTHISIAVCLSCKKKRSILILCELKASMIPVSVVIVRDNRYSYHDKVSMNWSNASNAFHTVKKTTKFRTIEKKNQK